MSGTKNKRAVITGVGVISPNGIGKDDFWQGCVSGRSGVRTITAFDASQFKSQIAGQVEGFEPRQWALTVEQTRRLDRYATFAVAAAKMAVSDAALNVSDCAEKMGVSIATAIAGTKRMEEEFLALTENGTADLSAAWAEKALSQWAGFNVASLEVASIFGARGPSITLATGCTAGLDAFGFALDRIRDGSAKVMLAGASEGPLTPIAMAAFDVIGALSTRRNGAPQTASRPYDKERDGFVLAEGAAVFVIEEREHALSRKAKILAELQGFGSTCNAYHMTDLPPDGTDLLRSMQLALEDAGLTASDIDYISSHGSSTQQNDVNETSAYRKLLGARANDVPVSSLKSMTGHALAAANAIEIAASVMTIQTSRIHPTINYEHQDPRCDMHYVPNRAIDRKTNAILKTASGFSGIHSTVIISAPDYVGGRA